MEIIQKNCTKKDINDSDNHYGVVIHPEPDLLECEVKWALGITDVNKASGGDIITAELFKILKDDANKVAPIQFSSVQFSCSVVSICDPTDNNTSGLPVNHQLLEPTQSHVHRVCDAIQPSHSLLSPSPPALNLSQHLGLSK